MPVTNRQMKSFKSLMPWTTLAIESLRNNAGSELFVAVNGLR